MEQIDGRALTAEALGERQRTIIRMKKSGNTAKEISGATGCSIKTVYSLWDRYRRCKNKKKFFVVGSRGNKEGNGRTLTLSQENKIKKIMLEKYPDQLKFDFALWTRVSVKMLIEKLFSIDMPIRTVGQYLQRWGFTPQKPIKHSYKRDEAKIEYWLKTEFPAIKRKAKRQKAEIYWEDETSIETGDIRGKGYSPKGNTPVVKNTEIKIKISMISAITSQGKVFWKLHGGTVDGIKFLEFVKRLVLGKKKKIFLILDNAKVHRSKVLAAWLKENKDKIELFFIPPYSPELNPDERINSDVKYGIGSQIPKRTEKDLSSAVNDHMNMLKKNPSRIKKYFKDEKISYAS